MDHIMDSMMRSMMMPFGDMFGGDPMYGGSPFPRGQQHQHSQMIPHQSMMFPGGFPLMGAPMFGVDPFQQMMSMSNTTMGPSYSYSSSTVTSYTTDDQGRPQVRQESHAASMGPDGLRQTKSTLRDTRSGHNEIAIGHHIKDKGHVKKKSKNVYTGEEEHTDELLNLDEEEAAQFDQEWQQKARAAGNFGAGRGPRHEAIGPHHGSSANHRRLAITGPSPTDSCPARERVNNVTHPGESPRRSRTHGDPNGMTSRTYPPSKASSSHRPKRKSTPKRHERL